MDNDIRWKQRFANYKKALSHLSAIVEYAKMQKLNDIEQLGIVKAFELSFELSWNVMKDYLSAQGINGIIGSKDSVRYAFQNGLIADGQVWMAMIDDRNAATHTYEEVLAQTLAHNIANIYHAELVAFAQKMEQLQ
ncbi:MAG: nucleotidyltransferase substrate binding protein [Treponemataceae bacterium]|nr:MAG: nucleotidyltransferase substrate binding protein [Treponemataceae bacterium]